MKTNNPWLGLKTYEEGQAIYGREVEIQQLTDSIIYNTQTVVYGKSGIGKSSIMNAGVFPVLRRKNIFPVAIRLNHNGDCEQSYTDQIFDSIVDSLSNLRKEDLDDDCRTIIRTGIQGQIEDLCPDSDKDSEMSLWELMHRFCYYDEEDNLIRPALVFDQFEEIFTLQQSKKKVLDFFGQLSDLINNLKPEGLSSKRDYISSSEFHIVIMLREDFLSHLERYTSTIPSLKHNRFCLQPMSEDQAAVVIEEPRPGLVSREVCKEIICKITGASLNDFEIDDNPELEVDSAILSLYLNRLYELMEDKQSCITSDHVNRCSKNIIFDFYIESIAGVSSSSIDYIENNLVNQDGRRENISVFNAIHNGGVTEEELVYLRDQARLIRQFSYGGDLRIELVHDILCPVVRQHKAEKELIAMQQYEKEQEFLRHKARREQNQMRYQADLNVLTVRGRRLTDNTIDFGAFLNVGLWHSCEGTDHIDSYNLLDWNWRYFLHNNIDASLFGQLVETNENYTTSLEYRDSDGKIIQTMDCIDRISVQMEGNKILCVKFHKKFDNRNDYYPLYIKGFCGISLEYDDLDREIKRTYIDENGNPVKTRDGYAGVIRKYDTDGNVCQLTYTDEEGKITKHYNGNCGFISEFNVDGLEIKRTFIDAQGNPIKIQSGIYARKYKYDSLNRLIFICNLDFDDKPIKDYKDYTAVKFEYDEESKLILETYCDEYGNPIMSEQGLSITKYEYGKNEDGHIVAYEWNLDTEGKLCVSNVGSIGNRRILTNHYEVSILETYGINKELLSYSKIKYNSEGVAQNIFFYENNIFSGARWIRYDSRNCFVLQAGQLNANGQKEGDGDGGYGSQIERNPLTGLPIAVINIDRYNQPIPDDAGVFKHIIVESKNGNVTQELYLNQKGEAQANWNGVYGKRFFYDEKDNLTEIIFTDKNGDPMISESEGYARVKNKYDDQNRQILCEYFDIDGIPCSNSIGEYSSRTYFSNSNKIRCDISQDIEGRPINNEYGYCKIEIERDEKNRIIKYSYLDVDGNYVKSELGWCIKQIEYNDEKFEKTEKFLDEYGQLAETTDGVSIRFTVEDEIGRPILEKTFDSNNNPSPHANDSGDYGIAYSYGEDNKTILVTFLGPDGTPFVSKNGYASIKKMFDEEGRVIQQMFLDIDGYPYKDNNGYGMRTIYTDQGNRYIYLNLDENGNPMLTANGYFAIEKVVDSQGRILEEYYLDESFQPAKDETGVYGRKYSYDDGNNIETTIILDENRSVTDSPLGFAYLIEYRDDHNNIVRQEWYDSQQKPIINEIGIFIKEIKYEEDGLGFTVLYRDSEGIEMACNEGNFGFIRRYDEQDRLVLEINLGPNEEPLADEYGIIGFQKDYLEDGTVLVTNINCELEPQLDGNGVYKYLYTYDENGQDVINQYFDQENNPMINCDGYAVKEKKYDEFGNVIEERYYDSEGNPTLNNYGEYGRRLDSTEKDSESLLVSLDADGKPSPNNDGYVYLYRDRDEQGRVIKEMKLDKFKAPIQDELGDYGIGWEFEEDGTVLAIFLDEDGNPHINKKGYTYIEREFDNKDRKVRELWYDVDKKPYVDPDGNSGIQIIYDDTHHIEQKIGLDSERNPHNAQSGWCYSITQYDDDNREILYMCKTIDGNLFYDEDGIGAIRTEYVDGNKHFIQRNCDEEGNLVQSKDGFSLIEIWKDENGRVVKKIWYTTEGILHEDEEGMCGKAYSYVEKEDGTQVVLTAHLDKYGEIIVSPDGIAYGENLEDKNGRLIRQMFFNEFKQPCCNEEGDYGVYLEYADDSSSEPNSIIHLDISGVPHNNNKGVCRILQITDNSGNSIEIQFDLSGNFVNDND